MSEEMSPIAEPSDGEETLAREMVKRARSEGVELVGPGGLLTDLTKTVLETALEVEMEDHLGYVSSTRQRDATAATRATAAVRRRC